MSRGPVRSLWRLHAAVWLSALLMLVLLAGLDLPVPNVGTLAPTTAVLREERSTHPQHGDERLETDRVVRDIVVAGQQVPRPRARTLSVSERGLPQPRAPSA